MVLREKITFELNAIDAIVLFNLAKKCAGCSPRIVGAMFERVAEALRAGVARSHTSLDDHAPAVEAIETLRRITPWQS